VITSVGRRLQRTRGAAEPSLLALAVATTLLCGGAARAEQASERLTDVTWDAPAACPEIAQIRSRIAALLGQGNLTHESASLRAHAGVRAQGHGFAARVELSLSGAAESKHIDAEDCATLADAYALIVAFALDPSAGHAHGTAASRSDTHHLATSPRAASRPKADAPALTAGPVGAVGVGMLPFPAFGVGGRVAAGRALQLELAALYWPERHTSLALPDRARARAEVRLITGESALCLPFARGALGACLGLEAGVLRAVGTGVPHRSRRNSSWVSASAGLTARLPIARVLALRVRLIVGVPFIRPRFALTDLGPDQAPRIAFQPAPVFGGFRVEP
jgi:hypothetical protein